MIFVCLFVYIKTYFVSFVSIVVALEAFLDCDIIIRLRNNQDMFYLYSVLSCEDILCWIDFSIILLFSLFFIKVFIIL